VNRQIGVEKSKYEVTADPLRTDRELETSNLAHRLITSGTNRKMQN